MECKDCNKLIVKSNWSYHIKTKKHLNNLKNDENIERLFKESNIQRYRFFESDMNGYIRIYQQRKSDDYYKILVAFSKFLSKIIERNKYYKLSTKVKLFNNEYQYVQFDIMYNDCTKIHNFQNEVVESFLSLIDKHRFIQFEYFDLNENKYIGSYVELPENMKKKNILNIKNKDHKSLIWCILAHFHPIDRLNHPDRVSNYIKYENEIKIKLPINPFNIETNNSHISINLYDLNGKIIYKTRKQSDSPINILKYEDHYCLIKNLDKFLQI